MMDEWEELEPARKIGQARRRADVEFQMRRIRGAAARGVVTVSASVLKQLPDLKTWRVQIRLGKGVNVHMLSIVPDPQGRFELAPIKNPKTGQETGVYRITLPPIERFPNASVEPMERTYGFAYAGPKRYLTIDLPAYCYEPKLKEREEARAK